MEKESGNLSHSKYSTFLSETLELKLFFYRYFAPKSVEERDDSECYDDIDNDDDDDVDDDGDDDHKIAALTMKAKQVR